MIPHQTPFFLPWVYPGLVWRMSPKVKKLYLSFDDGPVPGATEFVLDVLKQYNIKATFFCIGDNIRKHPYVFARILSDGHAVGNHTYHHMNGWKTPYETYITNVTMCSEIMRENSVPLVAKPNLFRPPYGRITRKQVRALQQFKIIMWDVLSKDYDRTVSYDRCLEGTWRATRTGSIVVFHDSLKAEQNLSKVLPAYIERCLDQGFSFDLIT